jgi:hypothetical protein
MELFQECTYSSKYWPVFQEKVPLFQGEERNQQEIAKMKRGSEKIIYV